ncbi:hypothetical protein [Methylovulum psychrotolerans]|uniref:Uncharacterized protein n=1 Tax=Methylovulum psychrotolerans TaxID=1704499 RepID=A0A1Z4C3P4_9GAMM|nr:hypothetical protein [Methylovulum psychrotolerans]ASF48104.1 hypothetical protein CEK71_19675 [Methylovulum psychrotolerans]
MAGTGWLGSWQARVAVGRGNTWDFYHKTPVVARGYGGPYIGGGMGERVILAFPSATLRERPFGCA